IIDTNYRNNLSIRTNDVVFLYMGRIVPGNGVLELIKAFQEAYGQNNSKHLIVAGFHNNKSKYEEEVRGEALKNSNIHTLEFQENAPELIASSDVMICPFTKPHFSRSIIEAAAMMKPAIASDIGGPNELILNNTTGLLYDINKKGSLTECILQLGENKNLRVEFGRNALSFAQENFDSVKNAKRTFEFYNRFQTKYHLQH
ncbi:glycosyltransferase family 4 protein, partial [Paenibacillus sp. Marseille-Q4541]|uniref:glycosyltransferase family 4 protein n=1 Tax=Paenibacillus sp. Marseille-Q4541 TaxID=2831522 RepID=UPI001BA4B93F